ncbi:undecaprenyl-phosphate glucose phosphotransferase [Alsobacter sp. R-9]
MAFLSDQFASRADDHSLPQDRAGSYYVVEVMLIALAVAIDVGVIVAGSALASTAYGSVSGISMDLARSRESGLVVAAFFVTLGAWGGAYRLRAITSGGASKTIARWLMSIGLFLAVTFLFKSGAYYSRGALLVLAPVTIIPLLVAREILARVMVRAIDGGLVQSHRVVLIGENDVVEQTVKDHLASVPQAKLIDCLRIDGENDVQAAVRDAVRMSQQGRIDAILIGLPWTRMDLIKSIEDGLRQQALPVVLLTDIESMALIARPIQYGAIPAFELKRAALGPADLFWKRALDIIVSLGAMMILWPVMLAAAVAIKLESPGPVFFRQRRHGFNNREFAIYKFRTMRVAEDGQDVRQATRNDPRITRVGAFLRRTSIDELPQILNVLRGEMSIVGPRPHAVAHNEAWIKVVEGYARRHNIRPGITGLAQVHGFRGQTDTPDKIDARVRLDLQYIETWSLGQDIRIMFRTALVLFSQDEAY